MPDDVVSKTAAQRANYFPSFAGAALLIAIIIAGLHFSRIW